MRNLGSRTKASLPIAGNLPTVVYCPNSNRPVSKPAAQSYGSYSTHLSGNVFRTDSALGSNPVSYFAMIRARSLLQLQGTLFSVTFETVLVFRSCLTWFLRY